MNKRCFKCRDEADFISQRNSHLYNIQLNTLRKLESEALSSIQVAGNLFGALPKGFETPRALAMFPQFPDTHSTKPNYQNNLQQNNNGGCNDCRTPVYANHHYNGHSNSRLSNAEDEALSDIAANDRQTPVSETHYDDGRRDSANPVTDARSAPMRHPSSYRSNVNPPVHETYYDDGRRDSRSSDEGRRANPVTDARSAPMRHPSSFQDHYNCGLSGDFTLVDEHYKEHEYYEYRTSRSSNGRRLHEGHETCDRDEQYCEDDQRRDTNYGYPRKYEASNRILTNYHSAPRNKDPHGYR